jgi:hypothetical protein
MVRKQDDSINNFLILLKYCNSCVKNTKKKKPAKKASTTKKPAEKKPVKQPIKKQ